MDPQKQQQIYQLKLACLDVSTRTGITDPLTFAQNAYNWLIAEDVVL